MLSVYIKKILKVLPPISYIKHSHRKMFNVEIILIEL